MEWDFSKMHMLDDNGHIIVCKDKGPCSRCECKSDCRILKGSGAIITRSASS